MIVNEREKTIYQQGFMSGSNAAQAAIKAAERRAEIAERAFRNFLAEYFTAVNEQNSYACGIPADDEVCIEGMRKYAERGEKQ